MKKRPPSPEHADTLSLTALRSLVTGLVERSQQAEARLATLEAETVRLGEDNAALRLENTRLKGEDQLLRRNRPAEKPAAASAVFALPA
jgi:regulator of replication initiation timing